MKRVRDEFVHVIESELKLSKLVIVDQPFEEDSPRAVAAKFNDSIVLGFKTEEWILEQVPASSELGIRYRASGMFYLPREERYIWRELCGLVPKDSAASLTALAANSGQGLRDRLADTAGRCAKQLVSEIMERPARK